MKHSCECYINLASHHIYFILLSAGFLKKADLQKTSTKKVIQALELKLKLKLRSRKDEIDKIVMDYINSIESEESEVEKSKSESDNESEEEKIEKPRVSCHLLKRRFLKKS